MQKVFYKNFFRNKTKEQINSWLKTHKTKLIGSAIFTKGQSITANVVAWAEGWRCPDKTAFRPAHTGSIVEKDGEVLIFDMKPPRASVQSLEKYLWLTNEDFVLVLRDFKLDTKMFSLTLLNEVGKGYPYLSAVRSVFNKHETRWNCHCSELHARTLKLCGYEFDNSFNLECTPDELLHYMISKLN